MADIVTLDRLQAALGSDKAPFVIRTSDRILFKRCRRLWGWMSHHRQGRTIREPADYFWFGSGIHYALEDFHGLNLYEHPAKAFMAYLEATKSAGMLPPTHEELLSLGISLMSYYADHWLRIRDPLTTLEVNGIPQVEVNGAVDMGAETPDGRPILYGFTIDRMVIDEYGQLWIVEYKTAKQIRLYHFDVDDQITAYCWAAWKLYQMPVAGVIYQQFRKQIPVLPKVLATGKVSTDLRQPTSAALYAKMLTDMYGSVELSPQENVVAYNRLLSKESEDGDRFIVRHRVERNHRQLEAFEKKVLMEIEDIANPNLALYPNPTKDCDYMCPMQAACVAMDDGSDWEGILEAYSRSVEDGLTQREKEQVRWRNLLPEPQELQVPAQLVQYSNLMDQVNQQEVAETLSPEEAFLEELGSR